MLAGLKTLTNMTGFVGRMVQVATMVSELTLSSGSKVARQNSRQCDTQKVSGKLVLPVAIEVVTLVHLNQRVTRVK